MPSQGAFTQFFGDRLKHLSHGTSKEQIKLTYDNWASVYDQEVVHDASGAYHQPLAACLDEAIHQLYPHKPKDEIKIIDAAAGTGLMGVELQKLGYTSLCALDISDGMLNEANKKNVYKKFICAALTDQEIPEIQTGEFDALICGGSMFKGHIRSSALTEMVRIVNTGGLLCFNIRDNRVDDFRGKILELENAGIWENVCERKVPHFDRDELPRETSAFVYKILMK